MANKPEEEDVADELEADCDECDEFVWILEPTWLNILSKLPFELQLELRPPADSMDGRFVVVRRIIWLLVSELSAIRNFERN
jgi:hypothetical protein